MNGNISEAGDIPCSDIFDKSGGEGKIFQKSTVSANVCPTPRCGGCPRSGWGRGCLVAVLFGGSAENCHFVTVLRGTGCGVFGQPGRKWPRDQGRQVTLQPYYHTAKGSRRRECS